MNVGDITPLDYEYRGSDGGKSEFVPLYTNDSYYPSQPDYDRTWGDKLEESKNWTLYEGRSGRERVAKPIYPSIEKSGVKSPVVLDSGEGELPLASILNGHHRIAAAADINPDMEVPVWWLSSEGRDLKSDGDNAVMTGSDATRAWKRGYPEDGNSGS